MRRFLLPNNTVITENALRDLYRRVRNVIASSRDKSDAKSVTEETLAALEKFFKGLGKPQFEHSEIQPEDPIIASQINEILDTVINDINVGYDEAVNLRDTSIATYNFSSVHISELQRRADEIAGLVTDLRLLSDQHGEEVIVFSDNFVDDSKIDPGFPTEFDTAETMPGQGTLTLHRLETESVGQDEVVIEVTPLVGITREPNQDNIGRFYEGHFYSFLGEAEPEGGSFHISEEINQDSLSGYDQSSFTVPDLPKGSSESAKRKRRRLLKNLVVQGGKEASFLERLKSGVFNDKFSTTPKGRSKFKAFVAERIKTTHRADRIKRKQFLYYYRHPDEAAKAGFNLDTNDVPLTAENFIPMDKGASEEELQQERQKVLDGNPASYWQCELVRDAKTIQDYVDKLTEDNVNAEISPDELRKLATSLDKEDLEVEIIFRFSEPRVLSWITFNPMTFDDGAYLEISDVSTSPDLDSTFVPVESFLSNKFSNILTEEANEELPKDLASAILAPSAYSYRGIGIWPFAARTVQKVRIRVKQRSPVPNPFERYVIEGTRTVTRTKVAQ